MSTVLNATLGIDIGTTSVKSVLLSENGVIISESEVQLNMQRIDSFSVEQKIHSIEFLLENRVDPSSLILGSGSSSLEDAIELTKFTAKIQAKASLLIPAFYFKNVTDDGVINYYRNVIEQTGDNNFKFLLYNF